MIYVYLANGFEETEAIFPIDLMRRAGLDVKTVSITDDIYVRSSHGITVKADLTVKSSDYKPYDTELIMLPGGMPGTTSLDSSKEVHAALEQAFKNQKYIAAICAAPLIIGKKGFLNGKYAVCYPGFEEHLFMRKETDAKCVRDGNIITAAGAGVAMEFGLKIVETLCGKDMAEKIKNAIIA